MDDNWKTPNPYGEFRGVASVGEGSTQCRRTDERHGAWQLGWGAGYSDRCPEGWMVVQAGEIQRLHNECEALRVERDSARASDEPLVSLTREGREWAAVQVRDLGSLAAQRGRRITELEAELQVIRAHLLSQETAEAMQLAIVSTHREDKRPEMWALSAVYTSAALAVIAAALAAADREAPNEPKETTT